MAKFTVSKPLNMEWRGHSLVGTASTTYRIADALYDEFIAEFVTGRASTMMPDIAWISQDELTASGGEHPNLAAHDTLGLATQAELDTHAGAADPHTAYALDTDLSNHEGAADPHTGYQKESEKAAANGYASLDASTLVPIAQIGTGPADTTKFLRGDRSWQAPVAAHPDLATHDTLGLATQAELDTHAAGPHGGSLPAGLIVMWGGAVSAIPSGWLLCDGLNGTPDLRSKFIKGAAAGSDPGATGGAATHTHAGHSNHAVTQPSAHTEVMNHTHATDSQGAHVHDEYRNSATTGGLDGWAAGDTSTNTATLTGYDTGSAGAHTHTAQNPAGGVASITHSDTAVDAHSAHDSPNSEPAYYALCFIQKS